MVFPPLLRRIPVPNLIFSNPLSIRNEKEEPSHMFSRSYMIFISIHFSTNSMYVIHLLVFCLVQVESNNAICQFFYNKQGNINPCERESSAKKPAYRCRCIHYVRKYTLAGNLRCLWDAEQNSQSWQMKCTAFKSTTTSTVLATGHTSWLEWFKNDKHEGFRD